MKKFLLTVLALVALLPASAAKAHDPIILTPDQATPANGPLILDGTISFALYGALDSPKDTRGFRVNFKEGDALYFSILIPDLAPENQLDDASLPFLEVTDQAETTENSQSRVLIGLIVATIIVAITVAFKVSKKRNN